MHAVVSVCANPLYERHHTIAEMRRLEENMSTALADLTELLTGIPAGAWVAISESRHQVMAFGPDAQAVLSEAHEKGEARPLILRVPEQASAMFL